MRKVLSLVLALALISAAVPGAVRGREAKYVGGTISALQENTEGLFELGDTAAMFKTKKGEVKFTIPFDKIETLEYGQKAGRRLGVALVVSPLFLFSKKRKHFLTVGFLDPSGNKQGAVLELAKGIVKDTLSTLETKSGKKVEYESEEAKKHAEKQ